MLQSHRMKRFIYILPVAVAILIAIHAWNVSSTTDKKTTSTTQTESSVTATGTENTARPAIDPAADLLPEGLLPGQVDQGLSNVLPGDTVQGETSCVRSGCGGILCTEASKATAPDASCNIQPHFACFDDAVCEVQGNGQCGWTQSDSLSACLINFLPVGL
jgi:hypothetical protein